MCYLAEYPEWQNKVREEIGASVEKHRRNEDETVPQILARLTVDDWEAEFQLLEYCLWEAIRLGTTGTAFRRNISGNDMPIGETNEIIPNGAYAVYCSTTST